MHEVLLWLRRPELASLPMEFVRSSSSYKPSALWPNSSGYPKLGDQVVDYVKNKYMVAQEIPSNNLRKEIRNILSANLESILAGKGYYYQMPSRAIKLLVF